MTSPSPEYLAMILHDGKCHACARTFERCAEGKRLHEALAAAEAKEDNRENSR